MNKALEFAKKVLESSGNRPLSTIEIWQKGRELSIDNEIKIEGEPRTALSGNLLMDSKLPNSIFDKIYDNGLRYFLKKEQQPTKTIEKVQEPQVRVLSSKTFCERDLHPLLVSFVDSNKNFNANCQTIYHEKSKKNIKNYNLWLHPDIVGVYYPFSEFQESVIDMQNLLDNSIVKLFSFELKIKIDFSNLRESFFQAVSNSSWANEGYLVALNIDQDERLIDELQRLNNAFGIGIIKLNRDDIYNSQIVFRAKYNSKIDWLTVNRLVVENEDFENFIKNITKSINIKDVNRANYDNVLSPEEVSKYIDEKVIL